MMCENGSYQEKIFNSSDKKDELTENPSPNFDSDIHENQTLMLKIKCVNEAIDEIGFTTYHMKLFFH